MSSYINVLYIKIFYVGNIIHCSLRNSFDGLNFIFYFVQTLFFKCLNNEHIYPVKFIEMFYHQGTNDLVWPSIQVVRMWMELITIFSGPIHPWVYCFTLFHPSVHMPTYLLWKFSILEPINCTVYLYICQRFEY